MKLKLEQILLALMVAFIFAGATFLVANAQNGTPPPANNISYDNCVNCHKDVTNTWQTGAHGKAMTDPVFTQEWNKQGRPGACLVCHSTGYDPSTGKPQSEGVNCAACHNPIPANHPVDNMPVDTSPDTCGKCHSDQRF